MVVDWPRSIDGVSCDGLGVRSYTELSLRSMGFGMVMSMKSWSDESSKGIKVNP